MTPRPRAEAIEMAARYLLDDVANCTLKNYVRPISWFGLKEALALPPDPPTIDEQIGQAAIAYAKACNSPTSTVDDIDDADELLWSLVRASMEE